MYRGQKLTIDIGNSNIKMLFGNRKKVLSGVSRRTPENSFEDNMIVDIGKVYSVINEYILRNNLKVKSISFSIHGQDVVMRHIEIPIMEKKKLREAVEWEMNQYLPENGTNYYIDYEIIDRINTNEKKVYKLLTVAVPKEKVEQYVQLGKRLSIKINAIDISANCAARVFVNTGMKDKGFKSIGIIDIGSKSSSIVILGNGKLFMEREVPFGLDNITREISRRQQVNMEDATKYFIENFNFDKINLETEIDRRIQELFDNVSSTFLKVIEFYTTGKVQKNLDEIYVIGGGCKLKGIQDYLSKYLTSPVYVLNNLEKIGRKINCPKDCDLSFHISTLGLLLRKE